MPGVIWWCWKSKYNNTVSVFSWKLKCSPSLHFPWTCAFPACFKLLLKSRDHWIYTRIAVLWLCLKGLLKNPSQKGWPLQNPSRYPSGNTNTVICKHASKFLCPAKPQKTLLHSTDSIFELRFLVLFHLSQGLISKPLKQRVVVHNMDNVRKNHIPLFQQVRLLLSPEKNNQTRALFERSRSVDASTEKRNSLISGIGLSFYCNSV